MPHGKSKLYDNAEVALQGDVAAAPVSGRGLAVRSVREARREIDTLRSINSHLVKQIEVLKRREAQALHLADRDGLTGLYNRRRMFELLEASIADADRQGQSIGLLFIDLDGFKGVNDAHGHAVGDQLLITVASRIAGRARHGDFVCRYGGDEFVVILPRVADRAGAGQVVRGIAKRVALPYRIDGVELQVSASIGVALYPDGAPDAAELLRLADESMYRAKLRPTEPGDLFEGPPAPMRRRDDRPRRRPAV
jgi:diguanylate cyclase (GGDEF)-like protein